MDDSLPHRGKKKSAQRSMDVNNAGTVDGQSAAERCSSSSKGRGWLSCSHRSPKRKTIYITLPRAQILYIYWLPRRWTLIRQRLVRTDGHAQSYCAVNQQEEEEEEKKKWRSGCSLFIAAVSHLQPVSFFFFLLQLKVMRSNSYCETAEAFVF